MVWKWLGNEINHTGNEGDRILRDEEYDGQYRITLERCKTYDAITCGMYGDMIHTAYASSKESALIYDIKTTRLIRKTGQSLKCA